MAETPYRARSRRPVRKYVLLSLLILFLGGMAYVGVWANRQVNAAESDYHDVVGQIQVVEANLPTGDLTNLSSGDVEVLHGEFVQLRRMLGEVDQSTRPPAFLEPYVDQIPYLGERYVAARKLLEVGMILAGAGETASSIAVDTVSAFEATGVSVSENQGATWLEVLTQRQADIDSVIADIQEAKSLRESIDTSVLPDSVDARLQTLDEMFEQFDLDKVVDEQLPAARAALGADQPARYLLLFQNPAETRPSGGFPGTMALVTIEKGQLVGYEFFDVYDLNEAYVENRLTPRRQPWPLATYARNEELPILDAHWWADFPTSAEMIMSMYAETGWPEIDGVVAIAPAVVGQILGLTGSMVLEIDGETREITAENIHDEIERQRQLFREGEQPTENHKEVLALIGENLIERLKGSDRDMLKSLVEALQLGAAQRDLQVYVEDAHVLSILDERGWTGRIVPDPNVPTVAVTLANVTFGKTGLRMNPSYNLDVDPVKDGERQVTLHLSLENTGTEFEDPFYAGFQRWYVEITLPEGSEILRTTRSQLRNPEAPNGGSYELPVMPQEIVDFTIVFSMPNNAELLIRRQPGINTPQLNVTQAGCDTIYDDWLGADVLLDLTGCGR